MSISILAYYSKQLIISWVHVALPYAAIFTAVVLFILLLDRISNTFIFLSPVATTYI